MRVRTICDGRSAWATLRIRPIGNEGVAPPIRRFRTRARYILSFGFAHEPIRLTGCSRKPVRIFPSVLPRQVEDRLFGTAPSVVGRQILASTRGDASIPLCKGYGKTTNRKRLRNGNLVLWSLVGRASVLVYWRSHDKFTSGDHHHLRALRAFLELISWPQSYDLEPRERLRITRRRKLTV